MFIEFAEARAALMQASAGASNQRLVLSPAAMTAYAARGGSDGG
jgi:hypothetical protein